MNISLHIYLFVLVCVCGRTSPSAVEVSPDFSIHRSSHIAPSKLGVVYGAKSCGGPGRMLQMRFESCRNANKICRVPGDGLLRKSEIDFIPTQNIQQFGVRVKLSPRGFEPQTIYEIMIPNSTVTAGVKYTLTGYGALAEEFKDTTISMQCILFRADSGRTEVCMAANFDVI